MALYTLGDFHLSFTANKPMDQFGRIWKNHEVKIEKNCRKLLRPEDTFVIIWCPGIIWGSSRRRFWNK